MGGLVGIGHLPVVPSLTCHVYRAGGWVVGIAHIDVAMPCDGRERTGQRVLTCTTVSLRVGKRVIVSVLPVAE